MIMSAALSGCFAWSYVKRGYDNFSAYFNTFYNASQLFNDAIKDVAETKLAYNLSLIAGDHPAPFVISSKAKTDFNDVIVKASKVLQYHPHSAYTQDCLFMIGIGYYYQGDNLRGERKFLEIESKFPDTKRLAEAEMYYGGLQLNGLKNDVGRDRVRHAIRLARSEKKPDIVATSCEILADYYLKEEDTLKAADYLDTASVFSQNDNAAIYACRAGDLYTAIHEYSKAEKQFMRATDQARTVKVRFYSVYYLARVHRLLGEYYLSLRGLKNLRDDDKFFDFFPLVDYQEATALYDSGQVSTAVSSYQKIDTAYSSSPAATRSAFRLANIYLRLVGDFQTALKYYQKVGSHPKVYEITQQGQEMARTLQDFLIASYKVVLDDSLYGKAISAVARKDTSVKYTPAKIDSLYEHAAQARDQLAGTFLFKLQMPDSAVRSYKIILRDFPKSKVYPSALYTLGEHYYSSGDTATGRKYLEKLVDEHRESPYAASASSLLGQNVQPYVDSSQVRYTEAIALTNEGKYTQAVDSLTSLVKYKKSKVAPQALYTVGWIYENKLQEPDSAFKYYKELSRKYPLTDYGQRVKLAVTGFETAERDSALARKMRADSVAAALAKEKKADTTAHASEKTEVTKGEGKTEPGLVKRPPRFRSLSEDAIGKDTSGVMKKAPVDTVRFKR